MRLSSQETDALILEISKYVGSSDRAKLYLFGSRAQDHLKGGDIDLILVVSDPKRCQALKSIDYKILAGLKKNPSIGEQKIDLKIVVQDQLAEPFYAQAMLHAQLLWSQG